MRYNLYIKGIIKGLFIYIYLYIFIKANGIKIGPQHSPTSTGGLAGAGGQGNAGGGGCC